MQGGTPAPCRAIGPPVVTGSAFHPPGPAAAGLVAGTRGHRHPASGEGSKEPGDTWRGRPVPERSGERRAPRPGPLSGPSPTTEASGAALPSPTCPVALFCFLPLWALVKIWGNFKRCWTYGAVGLWRGARELTGRPWRARSTRVSSPSPALPTVAHHPGDRAQTYSESGGGKFLELRALSAQRLSQGTVEGGLRGPPVQLRPSSPHPSGQTFPAGLIP